MLRNKVISEIKKLKKSVVSKPVSIWALVLKEEASKKEFKARDSNRIAVSTIFRSFLEKRPIGVNIVPKRGNTNGIKAI